MSIGSFLTRVRQDTITYWANEGADGFGGYNWAEPVTMTAKWFDVQELTTDMDGKEVMANAVAFVESEVAENSMVAKGDYTDSAYSDPSSVSSAKTVINSTNFTDIKNVDWVRAIRMK